MAELDCQLPSHELGHSASGQGLGVASPPVAVNVPFSRQILFWSIALGGALFDLATKAMVFDRIGEPPAPPRPLVGSILELRTSYNPGALWGFGRAWQHSSLIFAILSVIAALAICYYLFVRGAAASRRLTAVLALIMAGALGNCYDRLVFGQVRDFVYFHVDSIDFSFPIFNFADNMLVIGAVALMLLALTPEPNAPAGTEPQPRTSGAI